MLQLGFLFSNCGHRLRRCFFSSLTDPSFGNPTEISDDLSLYANKQQTAISLKTLLDTGKGKHLHLFDKMYLVTFSLSNFYHLKIYMILALVQPFPNYSGI